MALNVQPITGAVGNGDKPLGDKPLIALPFLKNSSIVHGAGLTASLGAAVNGMAGEIS